MNDVSAALVGSIWPLLTLTLGRNDARVCLRLTKSLDVSSTYQSKTQGPLDYLLMAAAGVTFLGLDVRVCVRVSK